MVAARFLIKTAPAVIDMPHNDGVSIKQSNLSKAYYDSYRFCFHFRYAIESVGVLL